MSTEEILNRLREVGDQLEREYRAKVVGVFGSYARGEQDGGSDLDVLVQFLEKATLFDVVGLEMFLEEEFHCKVDACSTRSLRKEIEPSVRKDLIPL